MDMIIRITMSKGFDAIFVVVDMLTKMAHLFPIHNHYSTKDVAHVSCKKFSYIIGYLGKLFLIIMTLSSLQIFGRIFFKLRWVFNCLIVQLIILKAQTDGQTQDFCTW